ncbi:hypothetical protein EXIGLDRAFT_759819 [Exidia glandulosa HHB12029]|uniref:Uncharacterized protein n=1 Tax=Exidia glandulosa HHB12029 TaxID=1314781 RepID=A0A165PV16_EXIGL|nr:hypothetical protein EXIGLDRAFT_759819 [Exidia glandulosa HHB12029]
MTYLRFNKTSKKKLQLYGKAYARYGCAIVSPTKVIDQYLLRLHNGANDVEAEYSEEDDYVYAQWDALLLRCPTLRQELTNGSEDRIEAVKEKLDSAWSLARSDGVQALGRVIYKWISAAKVDGQSIVPHGTPNPVDVAQKEELGFINPTTARLLCPFSMDINAAGVREELEACERDKDDLPLVLFANFKVDQDNPDELCGSLQSDFLYWAYQYLFTGPRSAGKAGRRRANRNSKKTNSELANMYEVTGPSIGFACLILRFLLGPSTRFYLWDDEFDYRPFYKQIVTFIETECARPVLPPETLNDGQRFLKRWNDRIFGKQHVARSEASMSALVEGARVRRAALRNVTNS